MLRHVSPHRSLAALGGAALLVLVAPAADARGWSLTGRSGRTYTGASYNRGNLGRTITVNGPHGTGTRALTQTNNGNGTFTDTRTVTHVNGVTSTHSITRTPEPFAPHPAYWGGWSAPCCFGGNFATGVAIGAAVGLSVGVAAHPYYALPAAYPGPVVVVPAVPYYLFPIL